jgi:hypothetical protein
MDLFEKRTSGAKAPSYVDVYGTAEAVPFRRFAAFITFIAFIASVRTGFAKRALNRTFQIPQYGSGPFGNQAYLRG